MWFILLSGQLSSLFLYTEMEGMSTFEDSTALQIANREVCLFRGIKFASLEESNKELGMEDIS